MTRFIIVRLLQAFVALIGVTVIVFFLVRASGDPMDLLANPNMTEEQYNYWSVSQQALLVEIESAQKIGVIRVAPEKTADRLDWIAFEEFTRITE